MPQLLFTGLFIFLPSLTPSSAQKMSISLYILHMKRLVRTCAHSLDHRTPEAFLLKHGYALDGRTSLGIPSATAASAIASMNI